jgi:hypothetical protein
MMSSHLSRGLPTDFFHERFTSVFILFLGVMLSIRTVFPDRYSQDGFNRHN